MAPEYHLSMEKPCKICQQSRVAFVWIVVIIILANSVYQLSNSNDGLATKDILLIPIAIGILALLIKLFFSFRK